MQKIPRTLTTPSFIPDYVATSVESIDFKVLAKAGIKYVAFDADSTLVPFRGTVLSTNTKKYLKSQQELFSQWCIASNRITDDLDELAESIDAKVVRAKLWVRKPRYHFFERVIRLFDAQPNEIVMIGDKLIADIFGAKRAGFVTVWVEHLGRDSLADRLTHIRHFERLLLKKYQIRHE